MATSTRSSVPAAVAATQTASTPATVRPTMAAARPSTRPATRASPRASARELGVERRDAFEGGVLGAQHDELGGAAQELEQLDRELGAGAGLARAAAPPAEGGEDRGDDAAGQQAGGQHEAGGRQEGGADRDRHGAGEQGDERRREAAQEEVLQGIDVAHHARQQVATSVAFEAGRHERLEPRVKGHPHAGEQAEGEVVRGKALEVARDRAG